MFRIEKEFAFEASHSLDSLPEGHQCRRLHGHSYRVRLVLEGTALDDHGFVQDFGTLDVIQKWIKETLDHRHLNDLLTPSSAEHLAFWIFDRWVRHMPRLAEVRVSETVKTWACYRPGRRPADPPPLPTLPPEAPR
jgi:6-pyruvoyltetrahydropterin/6-carboxytetrahydropterin synthase